MCGIIGFATTLSIETPDWIKAGLNSISHRGPDHEDLWSSKNNKVHLGHRRLSIIDLSTSANQPMSDEEKKLHITYNGEIYNYLDLKRELTSLGHNFRGASDTEVIIASYAQWGLNFVKRLEGMFAFCLFDENTNKIILGRDRAGEKPLFYYKKDKSIRFSSELKGLLQDKTIPRKISHRAIDELFHIGFISNENCIFEGFNKLEAGELLTFCLETGKATKFSYWSLPKYSPIYDEAEIKGELKRLLTNSISNQLEASNVPVGLLLSGGLDSSIITALASIKHSNIKTYNVSFPGHEKLDESSHAKLISNFFSTNHTELQVERLDLDVLPKLAWQYDEPIFDSSMLPTYLLTEEIRKNCKVALGGDGGDELFAGYDHYSNYYWQSKNLSFLPLSLRKAAQAISTRIFPVGFKGRNYLDALGINSSNEVPFIYHFFDKSVRNKIFKNLKFQLNNELDYQKKYSSKDLDVIQRLTRMDFKTYLAEDILVKVDRASMLSSLELRAPFLSANVIDFAFGKIPSNLKANDKNKKIILKKIAKDILPREFNYNRKQGFSIPINTWLREKGTRSFFEDILLNETSSFSSSFVKNLFKLQDRGYQNGERIFALTMFELWKNTYNAEF